MQANQPNKTELEIAEEIFSSKLQEIKNKKAEAKKQYEEGDYKGDSNFLLKMIEYDAQEEALVNFAYHTRAAINRKRNAENGFKMAKEQSNFGVEKQ